MVVKKSCGKIFGADLTASERKAMEMEIRRQMAEIDRNNLREIDAIILWELHEQLGLGPERMKRFYRGFHKSLQKLLDRYEMEEIDQVWLCTQMLKDYGIDLDELAKECEYEQN